MPKVKIRYEVRLPDGTLVATRTAGREWGGVVVTRSHHDGSLHAHTWGKTPAHALKGAGNPPLGVQPCKGEGVFCWSHETWLVVPTRVD